MSNMHPAADRTPILEPTVPGAKISYKEASRRSLESYFSLITFLLLGLIQFPTFFFLLCSHGYFRGGFFNEHLYPRLKQ